MNPHRALAVGGVSAALGLISCEHYHWEDGQQSCYGKPGARATSGAESREITHTPRNDQTDACGDVDYRVG